MSEGKCMLCGQGIKAAPEKPSAPREVTTENLGRRLRYRPGICQDSAVMWRDDGGMWLDRNFALDSGRADIRANVERETKGLREENARLRGEVERLNVSLGDAQWARDKFLKERDEAKAANREQRRRGAEDAAHWLEHMRGNREDAEFLRGGLMIGEVMRDGEKQERAPEKTGRLPSSGCHIFARMTQCHPWFLNSTYEDAGMRGIAVDVPTEGGGRATVYPQLAHEGVLWCWPRPGMV